MFKGKKEVNTKAIKSVDTVVGSGTVIEGKISLSTNLRVDGKIEGEINSTGDIFIGKQGSVGPTVRAVNVTIAGAVNGDVYATEKVYIQSSGKLSGSVTSKGIVIDEGGLFNGQSTIEALANNNKA